MDKGTSTTLRGHEVAAIARKAGYEASLSRPVCNGRTLVDGHFDCLEYAGGLSVHTSDLTELVDVTSRTTLSPRVSFIVLLSGELHFALDDTKVQLASKGFDVRCGAMILDSTTTLDRQLHAGARVSKVHVTVTPEWLQQHCADVAPNVWALALSKHKAMPVWRASREMASAAKAILAPSSRPACLQKLFVENQAAIIVSEGLSALHNLSDTNSPDSRRVHQIAAVQEYVDSHLTEPLDLAKVGRRFGMSTSTLQRYFKRVTGMTVGAYVRAKRLEQAREQLKRQRITISQAAYLAGYSHSNNFIAAYKKRFGCSPGEDRCTGSSEPSLLA